MKIAKKLLVYFCFEFDRGERGGVAGGTGEGGGGVGGGGGGEDRLTEERNINTSDGVIGNSISGSGNSKTSATAMMTMMVAPPSPSSSTDRASLVDRPLNLEVQKRPSCAESAVVVVCRPPSSDDNDYGGLSGKQYGNQKNTNMNIHTHTGTHTQTQFGHGLK